MYKHVIKTGTDARQRFLVGARMAIEIIGSTLGPKGRNVMVEEKYRYPLVHNDGVNAARKIVLEDPIADLAYQSIVNVAMVQNERAGDGTSTATLINATTVETCWSKLIADISGGDPVGMGDSIEEDCKKVIEYLKSQARPLKKDELINVINTSLRDKGFSKEINDMLTELGKDCYISVEDNWKTQYGITTEKISGMRKLGSYAHSFFVNTRNRKEAIWEETYVLVTNHALESTNVLSGILAELTKKGKLKLIIVSGNTSTFSKQFIQRIVGSMAAAQQNAKVEAMQILLIKAPALTSEELEDVAVFTGGKFIDEKLGLELSGVRLEDLGYVKKAVVDEDEFLFMLGKGSVKDRLDTLNSQLDLEEDTMFKEKLKRRIAGLSSGIGIIRVGAPTEAERSFRKMKIEDAVNAAKAALEEGVIPGGGVTLKEAAEMLGKDSLLYKPLCSINEIILKNANYTLKISKDILDPVKVTRLAVENACSAAVRMIAVDTGIAKQRKTLIDEFEKLMHNQDEEDDFRDDSNQDLGNGRAIS